MEESYKYLIDPANCPRKRPDKTVKSALQASALHHRRIQIITQGPDLFNRLVQHFLDLVDSAGYIGDLLAEIELEVHPEEAPRR